jgi:hypothetical protein
MLNEEGIEQGKEEGRMINNQLSMFKGEIARSKEQREIISYILLIITKATDK